MKRLSLVWICLATGLVMCRNPLDGVELRVKDPIENGVVEVRLYDPAGNPRPVSEVNLAGPDASRVVTTLNTNRYRVNPDGVLLLAASPDVTPSTAEPFRFTAVIRADEYLTVVQPVVLTGPGRVTRVVRQISLSKPPQTVTPARTTGRADATGTLTAPFGLTTASSVPNADQASIGLLTGTRLTNRDGQSVGGNLTMQVIQTHTRDGNNTSQIPGGGVLSNVTALSGQDSPGSLRVISLAGSVTVEVFNDAYQLAYAFSQPARWTMDINPATINGQRGRAVQPGDSIPLYSYDAWLNRWQEEPTGVVVRNAQTNRLEYRATASRTAAYVATWTERVCNVGPVFRVSSKLNDVDINYRCELIDATTGQRVSTFYANVNNNVLIRIYNQPEGRDLKLRVFDETDAWGKGAKGGLMAESAVGQTCNDTPVLISLAALPVPPVMKLSFNFTCPQGTKLDESALPAQIRTQYSETGKEQWRELITATRTERSVASYRLKIGRRYDFRASTDGGATWPLRQNDYLIDKPTWSLTIDSPTYCK
ncbi:MAG: hypothetical protein H7319_09820 [Spirosoma sp.]|nr:hypothetical protein [Spirosoma sp.]